MPMVTSSDTRESWLIRRSTGAKTPVFSGTSIRTIGLLSGKVSVNTGTFVPGVYRVNPYHVYSEEILASPYDFYGQSYLDSNYDVYLKSSSDGWFYDWLPLVRDSTVPTAGIGLRDQALQKAYGKVQRASIGMGENLGEIRETISMLRSPLQSLRKFLQKDRALNRRKLNALLRYGKTGRLPKSFTPRGARGAAAFSAELAKAAADTWLELRYGLRPLIMTIVDVMKELERVEMVTFNPQTIHSVRSRISTDSTKQALDPLVWRGSYGFGYRASAVQTETLTGYASVQYRMDFPRTVLQTWGLSPEFALETAWELTRLSFVVDWLFTVGPWLASYRIKPGVTILGNTCGVKIDRYVTVNTLEIRHPTWTTVKWPSTLPTCVYRYRDYERWVNQSLPLTPFFKGARSLDLLKAIDSASLLLQPLLKGIRR